MIRHELELFIFIITRPLTYSYNVRKFIELPYHASKVDKASFDSSDYLIDLEWIQQKISCLGCADFLRDTHLAQNAHALHLEFLRSVINQHYVALNYDGKQFTALLKNMVQNAQVDIENLAKECPAIYAKWKESLTHVPKVWLEIKKHATAPADDRSTYYDQISSLPGDRTHVITLSQKQQQICVWDVVR